MRIALAQINPTVGDFEGNLDKMVVNLRRAGELGADLVCFPELAITGYPPEDLLLKASFIEANLQCLEQLAAATQEFELTAVVGFVDLQDGEIYNAAAILHGGSVVAVYYKIYLPNYGVFDEKRYFQSGSEGLVFTCAGVNVGVTICEDIWQPAGPAVLETKRGGAQLILNLSASPYHRGKQKMRERMLAVRAADNICCLAYVNLVGGQDELVFDGNSLILDEEGNLLLKGKAFEEDLIITDLQTERILRTRMHEFKSREGRMLTEAEINVRKVFVSGPAATTYPPLAAAETAKVDEEPEEAEVYAALVLAVRDYVNKNNFPGAFIGLSGGIDSALTAAIAVDALGREQVTGVFMPSPITSPESREDAEQLAANLGIRLLTIPIGEIAAAYITAIEPLCGGSVGDLTLQNIQARIRGNLLMALTNQFGGIVLTTGNKSEMSTGYATLYGDMAGGFAVLKDIPKTLVYRLARYRNQKAGKQLIPQRILEKAPTAELRPDQKDEDDLPPYSILDSIIERYVEEDCSAEEIIQAGISPDYVYKAIAMINKSEYKRRQAPPGVKITRRAFGKDRRMPITHSFREG